MDNVYNLEVNLDKFKNVFVVGDIHGCYNELMEALDKVNFNRDTDCLVSVSDWVDRGKESFKCLKLVKEPWVVSCRGNHEQFVIDGYLEEWVMNTHIANGGQWFYDLNEEDKLEALSICQSMPLSLTCTYKGSRFGVTHADSPDDWDDVKNPEKFERTSPYTRELDDILLWSRRRAKKQLQADIANIDFVVFGHTVLKDIMYQRNQLFLDTGVVFGLSKFKILNITDVINTFKGI